MDIADYLTEPARHLTDEQRRWLGAASPMAETAAVCGWSLNRLLMHLAFRVEVAGRDNLPAAGPFLITPNHSSSLDPPVLAAALPNRVLRNTFWIARRGAVMRNFVTRKLGRWGHAIPFDREEDGMSALAVAATLLERGRNVVWFPEGRRSLDGRLQPFKFGVGALLDRFDVPAVPVHLEGAFEALPPAARWPRLRARIVVQFGAPLRGRQIATTAQDLERYELLADRLHDAVAATAPQADGDPPARGDAPAEDGGASTPERVRPQAETGQSR